MGKQYMENCIYLILYINHISSKLIWGYNLTEEKLRLVKV